MYNKLPRDFYVVNPYVFVGKLIAYCMLVALSAWGAVSAPGPWSIFAQALLGVLFAHAVELQHQCLHHTAFRDPRLNHLVGFLLGIPMLVSYSHYRARHLHHHKWLGTSRDAEFFDYRRDAPHSWWALLSQAYSMRRYRKIMQAMLLSLQGYGHSDARSLPEEWAIRIEYCLLAGFIFAGSLLSFLCHSLFLVQVWLVPLLLSAEATHYLIELPEHFRCDTTSRRVWRSTRTILGSRFSFWLTNGNNFHVEHHLYPRAPIERLPEIHQRVAPALEVQDVSYWAFFFGLIRTPHPSKEQQ